MRQPSKNRGFSLMELMIAVTVAGILASIGYPSYINSVQESRRTDAQATLMATAQKLEAYYVRNGSYTNATTNNMNISTTSDEGYYTISIQNVAASNYTLQAVPTTKGGQNQDDFKGYRLASTGARTHSKDGSSYSQGWK